MVNYCSAFNCTSSSDLRKDLSFHKFPINDKSRLQKWLQAVQRKDFKPSSSSILCSLHFIENDFYLAIVSGKKMLKKCAVPSVFNFSNHLIPKIKERKILQREDTTAVHNNKNTFTCETRTKFLGIGVQTKVNEELENTLHDLHKDEIILQQNFIRKDKRFIIQTNTNTLLNRYDFGNNMQSCKPKVTDLNPHLLCVLCGGYFVDATTVIECLHSFCRSCIVKYLERNKYCPICDVLVHKSKPLSNIRPDHTLQNIVYKLVPRLFQREMLMRRDFYSQNKVYIPRDPMSRGVIPDNYHIFTPNDAINVILYYENEKDLQKTHKRYMWCPASLTITILKKLVYLKYEITPNDHHVEFFFHNYLLDDHLTLMDVVYMFDWKRKDPITVAYRILKIEIESILIDDVVKEENKLELKKDGNISTEQNDTLNKSLVNTKDNDEKVPQKIEEKSVVVDKLSDSKEVQLEISENGIMKVTNISQSRETIQANVTIEPTDLVENENPPKLENTKDNDNKKKILKVYPGSKIKKTKPKLDTIVEKIKKQGSKYKTLTTPTKHWNPKITETSMLALKRLNGYDEKSKKFFKSRDEDKKNEDKAKESLKRLAEVPLMKINPQTLCPIMPSSPAKKPKKPIPKKNTLAHSLALLPVGPTNYNPFTNPLNPFMYGTFPNNSNGDPGDSNDILKAMSELCPQSSAYHNSLPPSVSVLFNPVYAHHRRQAKKATTTIAQSSDTQKLSVKKLEEETEQKINKNSNENKDTDECTNNNKGEEKMKVEKEKEKT